MEECDHLSTVSMLSDIDGGYGGLAALVAQFIREESKNISMVCHDMSFKRNKFYYKSLYIL